MDNIKGDNYFLDKIISDLEFIIAHTQGKTQAEIEKDELLVDSMQFRLIQVAENADKLSGGFKLRHSDLPWRAIKGMRNVIVHDYGVVDMTIVCDTLLNSIPELYDNLKDLI